MVDVDNRKMYLEHPVAAWAYYPIVPESCGTTLICAEYKDGVVLGADSRTSMGSYVSSRVTDKLTQVTDHIYCCRSGSAADTQAITDMVKYRLDFMRTKEGKEPTVYRAAQVFRSFCYEYRDQLSASVVVCGWDEELGGQVYAIPIGGFVSRQRCVASGSGSTFVHGYLDSQYKPDMDKTQAEKFVKEAVCLAMYRDGSSGGVCRLGSLTQKGMSRKMFATDAPDTKGTLTSFVKPEPYSNTNY